MEMQCGILMLRFQTSGALRQQKGEHGTDTSPSALSLSPLHRAGEKENRKMREKRWMNVGLRGKENIQPEFESHLFKYMIYDKEIFLVFPRKM